VPVVRLGVELTSAVRALLPPVVVLLGFFCLVSSHRARVFRTRGSEGIPELFRLLLPLGFLLRRPRGRVHLLRLRHRPLDSVSAVERRRRLERRLRQLCVLRLEVAAHSRFDGRQFEVLVFGTTLA